MASMGFNMLSDLGERSAASMDAMDKPESEISASD
jgi:hypothetical protein